MLLPELLHLIASRDMVIYYGLIRAYPRFARMISNGVRFDYAELFGIDYHVYRDISYRDRYVWYSVWTRYGQKHRADGPAVTSANGNEEYFIKGQMHRTDGPAAIYDNGEHMEYYIRNKLHREDGPAMIYANSAQHYYYLNGERHREDGPAVIYADDNIMYYINDKLHRTDGPAIIHPNGKSYYINGKLHRIDGPANYYDDRTYYHIDGVELTPEVFHEQYMQ